MALNFLIVDDSAITRKMIRRVLEMTDLSVGRITEAANGQEGLDALEGNWVDVVMADINMPVMDGEQMIRRMRDNPAWADIAVLVVSTEGSQTRIEQLKQLGARFLHKPFSPEQLHELITEMLGVGP